jgi:hypothetical protein
MRGIFLCCWIPLPCVSIQPTYTHGGVRLVSLCHVSPYRYWPLVTLMRQIPGLTRFLFFLFFILFKHFFLFRTPYSFSLSICQLMHRPIPPTFTVTLRPSVECYPTCLLVSLFAVISWIYRNPCSVTYSHTKNLPVLINVNRKINAPYFYLHRLASFWYCPN